MLQQKIWDYQQALEKADTNNLDSVFDNIPNLTAVPIGKLLHLNEKTIYKEMKESNKRLMNGTDIKVIFDKEGGIDKWRSRRSRMMKKKQTIATKIQKSTDDFMNTCPIDDKKETDTQSNNSCCICLTRPRNVAFFPCGHVCVCDTCHTQKKCPICRTPGKTLKVYGC